MVANADRQHSLPEKKSCAPPLKKLPIAVMNEPV
jgi:hypothetical protein